MDKTKILNYFKPNFIKKMYLTEEQLFALLDEEVKENKERAKRKEGLELYGMRYDYMNANNLQIRNNKYILLIETETELKEKEITKEEAESYILFTAINTIEYHFY